MIQCGVVVIGRNEGERLERCLSSVLRHTTAVVYVDSGSTDDSVAASRARGVTVVELDLSTPFTAARARNAGFARLRELYPAIASVQFVDGDCEIADGWLETAQQELETNEDVAATCGRLRERNRQASLYNACAIWSGTARPGMSRPAAAMPSFAPRRWRRSAATASRSWPARSRNCACGCGPRAGRSAASTPIWDCTTLP
jgi:glycosyltransferase involved in cell wall biosynthesis